MQLSFLLGSGFSIPDHYPSRKELNERLRKISHDEIMIHTDGTAWFLNGKKNPNANWLKIEERFFVEKFLDFYSSKIIHCIDKFDYESFFDYYQGMHFGRLKCSQFDSFTDTFRKQHNYRMDNTNLLANFHNTFNRLLASQFIKHHKHVYLSKPYSKYKEFLIFIEEISKNYDKIHFHSLNHDTLIEELSFSDAIQGKLSDGFEELESPFYSVLYNSNTKVRIERFTNKYDKKFCLYKLHGSIDYYIYNFQNKEYTSVKIPQGVSFQDLMKEIKKDNDDIEYDTCYWNIYPDFLSGTTEKILSYKKESFYKPMFDHFIENLKNSHCLISIGYGLGDLKINELIKDYFVKDKNKTMIIISPEKSKSDFFDLENVKYYGQNKKVQDINISEIKSLIIND